MSIYDFLNALPAILGFVGFIVYVFWTGKRPGDDLLKGIVEKLRVEPNIDPAIYANMTPARVRDIIDSDKRVRMRVNDKDIEILTLLVRSHFKSGLIVFACCVALVVLTVYLFRSDPFRPKPTTISQVTLESGDALSEGKLVDVFPLNVRWQATGKEQLVNVVLENTTTATRTAPKKILSSARTITFDPSEFRPILQSRKHDGYNIIRAVVNSHQDSNFSEPGKLYVGIEVSLGVGMTMIKPDGEELIVNFLSASLDQSDKALPKEYLISAQLIGQYWDGTPFVQILKIKGTAGLVDIKCLENIQWSSPYKLKYIGPEEPWKVSTMIGGVCKLKFGM